MNKLPKWVYDLVADLIEEEELHPTLFQQSYNGEYAPLGWCPALALERVPEGVMAAAVVVAQYRREQ